mgnify:CR=1 FL=1
MNDQQLDQAINNLNRAIMPEHDLWPAIAERLPQRQSAKLRLAFWASAASLVLVGLIAVILLSTTLRQPKN